WRHGDLSAKGKNRLLRRPDGITAGLYGRCAVRRVDCDTRRAQKTGLQHRSSGSWRALYGQGPDHGLSELSVGPDETGDGSSQTGTVGRRVGGEGGPHGLQGSVSTNPGAWRRPPRRPADVRMNGRKK